MTLPSYSQISMDQVNTECNYYYLRNTGLDDYRVRTLFKKSSGQISMSDGWGKDGDPHASMSIYFSWQGREVYFSAWNFPSYGYYEIRGYGASVGYDVLVWSSNDFGLNYWGETNLYFGPQGTDPNVDPYWYPTPKTNSFYCRGYDIFGDWNEIYLGTWTS